jgi:tRNA-splicing ligase RtcB
VNLVDGIPVFGEHDDKTVGQIRRTAEHASVVGAALMADGHLGYAMPIGGVVAYDGAVSPNGVGFDISCGNKAVLTDLTADQVRSDIPRIMDRVFSEVSFGIGSKSEGARDHALFDDPRWDALPWADTGKKAAVLRDKFRSQLGSVGSGNHYVDIFEDEQGRVWVGVHFGSRGLGHTICTSFMNLAKGMKWDDRPRGESMEEAPTVIQLNTALGDDYWASMELAGEFAYAGRDFVCEQVATGILGGNITDEIHNHHNYAWKETHNGQDVVVVRKGATPAFPGQRGFVGGSMGDDAVIVEGAEGASEQAASLFSTVHGAGRVMSRTQAAGKVKWRRGPDGKKRPERVQEGRISQADMRAWVDRKGVELRGAGTDEAPQAYRRLDDVLREHGDTIKVLHRLRPMGVAMAGADVFDPYKD